MRQLSFFVGAYLSVFYSITILMIRFYYQDSFMKKALLPFLIASALPVSAMAEVIVYGKANVSLQNADELVGTGPTAKNESQIELVSNASRIGLKGGEQINDSLKAIYQFEYQTEVDDGANGSNNQTFGQRNIYVGLQGSMGTIMGGNFDTPVKTLQEKIDLFNDLEGDIAFIVDGETRTKNIVQYTTPLFANKTVAINFAQVSAEAPNLEDGKSVSITFTTANLYFGAAVEQDITLQGLDLTRFAARYTIGKVQLGALYEKSDSDTIDNDDGWIVSAKLSATDKLAFKAQYGTAAEQYIDKVVRVDGEATQTNVGFDYMLSKNTMIFGYYTMEDLQENSVELYDNKWIGVGLELKF
jgi:predicted porin